MQVRAWPDPAGERQLCSTHGEGHPADGARARDLDVPAGRTAFAERDHRFDVQKETPPNV